MKPITLNVDEDDYRAVCRKAGASGLLLSELFDNFVNDLVDGAGTNGSDERMYANQWFDRCWFGMFPENNFLKYLIDFDDPEDFLESLNEIEELTADVEKFKRELNDGYMIAADGHHYTWEDLVNDAGEPFYKSQDEWVAEHTIDIEAMADEVQFFKESTSKIWNEYLAHSHAPEDYDEAIRKVRAYVEQLQDE